jgi:hypothetical protein
MLRLSGDDETAARVEWDGRIYTWMSLATVQSPVLILTIEVPDVNARAPFSGEPSGHAKSGIGVIEL